MRKKPVQADGVRGIRPFCPTCNKVAYESEARAANASQTLFHERGLELDCYLGPECGWWHLTSI